MKILLEKLASNCGVDPEHIVAYADGELLSPDSDVCNEVIVKAVRVVKGG